MIEHKYIGTYVLHVPENPPTHHLGSINQSIHPSWSFSFSSHLRCISNEENNEQQDVCIRKWRRRGDDHKRTSLNQRGNFCDLWGTIGNLGQSRDNLPLSKFDQTWTARGNFLCMMRSEGWAELSSIGNFHPLFQTQATYANHRGNFLQRNNLAPYLQIVLVFGNDGKVKGDGLVKFTVIKSRFVFICSSRQSVYVVFPTIWLDRKWLGVSLMVNPCTWHSGSSVAPFRGIYVMKSKKLITRLSSDLSSGLTNWSSTWVHSEWRMSMKKSSGPSRQISFHPQDDDLIWSLTSKKCSR